MPEATEQPAASETPKVANQNITHTPAIIKDAEPVITDDVKAKIAAEAIEKFKKEQEASDAEAKRVAKEEADREKGKFKDLYESESKKVAEAQAKLEATQLELKMSRVESRLRDHIQTKQPEYLGAAKYMAKMLEIKSDTKDEDADKQIASVFDQYVKDNPRGATPTTLPSPKKNEQPRAATNGVTENPFLIRNRNM